MQIHPLLIVAQVRKRSRALVEAEVEEKVRNVGQLNVGNRMGASEATGMGMREGWQRMGGQGRLGV